ncbi:MAG: hypothetical protein WDN31_02000 [Hyphomicrobium sp.]
MRDCAKVKLDPFDVDVSKTGDQSCQPGGLCTFDINIFNPNETVTHDDPVTVTDRLTGLSSAQIVSITQVGQADDFPCKPAPTQVPFSCTGPMKLSPKEENHYTMVIRLPADASAAAFSNCASLGPPETDGQAPRSKGSGSGPAEQQACHQVQLSPDAFSLKINKTGPATCAPGSDCAFDLTLTNTGSKGHVGAVSLTDGLSGVDSMRVVSIEPPLPCATQPQRSLSIARPADDFSLPAGGTRKFRVTARVPRSADTFTNCAILASAKGTDAAPRSGASADSSSSSCVTVRNAEPPAARKT